MRAFPAILLGACLLVLAGCASNRQRLEQALRSAEHPATSRDLPSQYIIRPPDVLRIRAQGRADLDGVYPVGSDGAIRMPTAVLHISGLTCPQAASRLAREFRLAESGFAVEVREHRSQKLYLVGEVEPAQQVIPYMGPETAVDLLRRIGVNSRADIRDVRIVRGHVADGKPPEVFTVDLVAILLKHDYETNVTLESCDHIHITPRRPSRVACFLPGWCRPWYEALFGIN